MECDQPSVRAVDLVQAAYRVGLRARKSPLPFGQVGVVAECQFARLSQGEAADLVAPIPEFGAEQMPRGLAGVHRLGFTRHSHTP